MTLQPLSPPRQLAPRNGFSRKLTFSESDWSIDLTASCRVVRNYSLKWPPGAVTDRSFDRGVGVTPGCGSNIKGQRTWRQRIRGRKIADWYRTLSRLAAPDAGRTWYCLLISAVPLKPADKKPFVVDILVVKPIILNGVRSQYYWLDCVGCLACYQLALGTPAHRPSAVRLANYFGKKATILANNAHTVMIQQRLSYPKRKIASFGNRKVRYSFSKLRYDNGITHC